MPRDPRPRRRPKSAESPDARRKPSPASRRAAPIEPTLLRIVGGRLGGRKILYTGDPNTRPMKQRVREAIFNLVGPAVKEKLAIDLFAGTGALGLEAISRGAARAIFVERHFPTADVIRRNAESLGVADLCQIEPANALVWLRRAKLGGEPWLVFCSPPYDFYFEHDEQMHTLVRQLADQAPPGSVLVVEADTRFDPATLPLAAQWDVRSYPPAVVAIYRKTAAEAP
jgi:16S rRNA (guanine966-N2)-methyltransferase